jgi:hypothetical protein
MNRPEAEKLLGGYAAGILTDAERRTLCSAALEHQELFDALMDEEALRELLADPEARQRLLAALPRAEAPKIRQWWRRPALMGLAASLFVLVTTSLIVLRHPEAPVFQSLPVIPKEAAGPAPAQALEPAAPLRPKVPTRGPGASPKAKPTGALQAPVGPPEPGTVAAIPAPEARKSADVFAAVPTMSKSLEFSLSPEPVETVTKGAGAAKLAKAGPRPLPAAPFETNLEYLAGGLARLSVTWEGPGHLYVLKRMAAGASLLAPAETSTGGAGMRTARFEFSLAEQDALDVYLLTEPAADPEALPATGALEGARRRVYPE